ncbi:MAG: toll/interleukin-1 receptor domain-containing protein [Sedimenticola sp.]
MAKTFELLNAIGEALNKEPRAYVYSNRTPFGAMLVKWDGGKRVLVQAWDSDAPIGRKRIHENVIKKHTFKGHEVNAWVFIVNNLRQNSYRLIDELRVTLLEVSPPVPPAVLHGTQNIPEGMQSVIIKAIENKDLSFTYDFNGLVEVIEKQGKSNVHVVARKTPKRTAFISYSWDSEGHRHWVLKLAADLIRNGINVIIDEWDLADYGNDLHYFMEEGIRESDFVLIVCTQNYANKANKRKGGVGVESSIITGEYYNDTQSQKYIPIICDENVALIDCLPSYLKGKLAITFIGDSTYDEAFESLLRRIADKPRFKKPKLGEFPELSSDEI